MFSSFGLLVSGNLSSPLAIKQGSWPYPLNKAARRITLRFISAALWRKGAIERALENMILLLTVLAAKPDRQLVVEADGRCNLLI